MKYPLVSLTLLSGALLLSACGESTPTAEELTQALRTKLEGDHTRIEDRINTMEQGLEHRSLSESLEMQRAQTYTVSRINQCTPLTDSDQQSCNVFLNIRTQGLKDSQERNVILNVSQPDGLWIMNKMSLPSRQ